MNKRILIVFFLAIILTLFACNKILEKKGTFKIVDGKEIYLEGKNQIIDKLVEVDGEKYYIGKDGGKVKNEWRQINNDGDYGYFGAMGLLIKNQVKEIGGQYYMFDEEGILVTKGLHSMDGEKYYSAQDGHLLCNAIVNIDNQDHYFGKDGKEIKFTGWVINEDGELPKGSYYLDEYGNRLKSIWQDDCFLDKDGLMLINQWVDGYYVGEKGYYLRDAITPDGQRLDSKGKIISESKTSIQIPANEKQVTIESTVDQREELYIKNREKMHEFYEYSWTSKNDNYDVSGCDITIMKPIIAGKNEEEVSILNDQISNLLNQLLERMKDEDVLSDENSAISDISLNVSNLKFTDNKVTIEINGRGKYSTDYSKDSSETLRFDIEYHRKEKTSKMHFATYIFSELNIRGSEYFYAE